MPLKHIYNQTISILKEQQFNHLVGLIEQTSNQNPYNLGDPEWIMWQEQCAINLPILYLASLYLYAVGYKKGYQRYIFDQAFTIHWIRIFKTMFADLDEAAPDSSSINVKLYGSGKRVFSLRSILGDISEIPIQMLNAHNELEGIENIVEPYHQCVQAFITNLETTQNLVQDPNIYKLNVLKTVLYKLFKPIHKPDQKPIVAKYITDLKKHPNGRSSIPENYFDDESLWRDLERFISE